MPNIELGRAFQLYRKMQVWCEVIVLTSDSLSATIHMHHKNCYYNDKNKRTSTKQYGMVALKKKKCFITTFLSAEAKNGSTCKYFC